MCAKGRCEALPSAKGGMMPSPIPNTNSPGVAVIATALYLADVGPTGGFPLKEKLRRFVEAYEVVRLATEQPDVEAAKVYLEKMEDL